MSKKRKTQTKKNNKTLWNGWKNIFLLGSDWNEYDLPHTQRNWDFNHLKEFLKSSNPNKKISVFGSTEPQMFKEHGLLQVPVLTAVIMDMVAPELIGFNSVQMSEELILPMKQFRMGFQPYFFDDFDFDIEKVKTNVFFLNCTMRKAALKSLKEDRAKKYEYANAYLFSPFMNNEQDVVTSVNPIAVLVNSNGVKKNLVVDFDWDMDDLDDYIEEQAEDNELDESAQKQLREIVRSAVKEQKIKNKEKKLEFQNRIDSISDFEKQSLKEMKCIKFYPQNARFLQSIESKFINRYYRNASEVRPPLPAPPTFSF